MDVIAGLDDADGPGAILWWPNLLVPPIERAVAGGSCSCVPDCAPGGPDGVVDVSDLLALLGAWGEAGSPCDTGDDVLDLLGSWGPCPAP